MKKRVTRRSYSFSRSDGREACRLRDRNTLKRPSMLPGVTCCIHQVRRFSAPRSRPRPVMLQHYLQVAFDTISQVRIG